MATLQFCIKERQTALLTYEDKLLEITLLQLGMEKTNATVKVTVHCKLHFSFFTICFVCRQLLAETGLLVVLI